MRHIGAVLLAVGLLILAAGDGRALTLKDLTDGQNIAAGNGLVFDAFEASFTGNQSACLADDLQIGILDDGFRIIGPMSAADGAYGSIFISYDVSISGSVERGGLISHASLVSNVAANTPGAQAAIDEFFNGGDPISNLKTGGTRDGTYYDSVSFDVPASLLRVTKSILLDSRGIGGGGGGSARVSLIEQHFSVVPEPATLGMTCLGLAVLALGRRRLRS